MADKELEIKPEDEVTVEMGDMPVAIALRVDEKTRRSLLTIRYGKGADKIKFNFGSYDGPTTRGGSPGDPPGCP